MSDLKPSWQDLNAYADGELSAAEAADVARAVAQDPDLAQQVAALTSLKATVQEAGQTRAPAEMADLESVAPAVRRSASGSRFRAWHVLSGIAAGLAAIVVGAAMLMPLGPRSDGPAWIDFAVRLHQDWAKTEPGHATVATASEPSAALLLASLSRLGPAAQVPDLSDARLTVGYLQPVSSEHGEGLHVGYRGTRGCRVSLIIMAAAGELPEDPTPLSGSDQQNTWRVGGLGYALLASGMDPKHYGVILQTVHKASRSTAPIGAETRTALRESRSRARPCAA